MTLEQLWQGYIKTRSKELRNSIVEKYIDFVGYQVGRVVHQLPPGVEKEDLVQFGVCGLIEAVERFDPNLGAKFETYATRRIQGAILDQIRYYGKSGGGLSRSAIAKSKLLEDAVKRLEQENKRQPDPKEVAGELGMKMEEYHKFLSGIGKGIPVSLDELVNKETENLSVMQLIKNHNSTMPEEEFVGMEYNEKLAKAIDELPPKERMVIIFYYYEELTLKEIGYQLNRSEGRISQLHTSAIKKLNKIMLGGE